MLKSLVSDLFDNSFGAKILVPHLVKNTSFEAILKRDGIYVPKLEIGEKREGDLIHKGLIKWCVFEKALEFIEQQPNHRAIKGNAQGGKRLNESSEFNTHNLEGFIANTCYGVKLGKKGVRRVTYYGAILVSIGLVVNEYQSLKINKSFAYNNLDSRLIETTLNKEDFIYIEHLLNKCISKTSKISVKNNLNLLRNKIIQTAFLEKDNIKNNKLIEQNKKILKVKLYKEIDELLNEQKEIKMNKNNGNSKCIDEKLMEIALKIVGIRRQLQEI